MANQKTEEQDSSSLADDHPIQEHWRNNKLLHSIEGTIQLAKEGDRYAAKRLLTIFVCQIGRYQKALNAENPYVPIPPDPKLLEYVKNCLTATIAGESADIALNLRKGKGRGRDKSNARQIGESVRIGYHVSEAMTRGESLENATINIARKFNVSESKAQKAYSRYMKK